MSKILTVVPTRGILYTEHQQALERELMSVGQYPLIQRTSNMPIPDCRNALVEGALKMKEWEYLLMLDDDIVMPEGGLQAMLDANAEVAFIDYPYHISGTKDGKEQMYGIAVFDDWKPGESTKGKDVAWAGLGCVLVKREVFEKLDRPFFASTEYKFRRVKGQLLFDAGHAQFDTIDEVNKGGGEDTHFFLHLRKAGIKPYLVHDMVCKHLRMGRVVYRLSRDRYTASHVIEANDRIDGPLL